MGGSIVIWYISYLNVFLYELFIIKCIYKIIGPPGTGKEYLTKSKYNQRSENLVRNLFDMAKNKKPSVLYKDEMDYLSVKRNVITNNNKYSKQKFNKKEIIFVKQKVSYQNYIQIKNVDINISDGDW